MQFEFLIVSWDEMPEGGQHQREYFADVSIILLEAEPQRGPGRSAGWTSSLIHTIAPVSKDKTRIVNGVYTGNIYGREWGGGCVRVCPKKARNHLPV